MASGELLFIKRIRVRHFRSLHDLQLDFDRLVMLCGPNSAGKSNVLRAIEFAWRPTDSITPDLVYDNLDYHKRDQPGGPTLSVRVEIDFAECPLEICNKFGGAGGELKYEFAATRKTAKVTRKINGTSISDDDFDLIRDKFDVVYVPPIRDISAEGLRPFRRLLARALARARGDRGLKRVADTARRVIKEQAEILLKDHGSIGSRLGGADGLRAGVDAISLDDLYEDLSLEVAFGDVAVPLDSMGTGHQSEVVLHLYKQLGEASPGDTVYLFEEPDNHLHPTMIRAIGDDLEALSSSDQVIATTHSPVLLNRVGFPPIRALSQDSNRYTVLRDVDISLSDAALRALVASIGIRATEPLLAKKVIVVEGPSDAVVLSELHRLRTGRTPDQCDILIIPAGGKDLLVRICGLLKSMDVEWAAVVDFDACLGGTPALLDEQAAAALSAGTRPTLQAIKAAVDTRSRRGKNAIKTIDSLIREIDGDRPAVAVFEGSHIERLVEVAGTLNATEKVQLASRLRRGQVIRPRDLLKKASVFLPSADLETGLLRSTASLDAVEEVLVTHGQQAIPPMTEDERRAVLVARLHNLAGDPDVVRAVVGRLELDGLLARTEVNLCYSFLFG